MEEDPWVERCQELHDSLRPAKPTARLQRAGLALKSLSPFSGFPHLTAVRAYTVRGILIEGGENIAETKFLEDVRLPFPLLRLRR
jgi:hypothetical protein